MNMDRKKYGWTVYGIVGAIFAPIGLGFTLLGIALWVNRAGHRPKDYQMLCAVFGGMGILFLILGILFLSMDLRRRARMRRALEGGYYVMAKITGVHPQRNVSINGRHPYVVECCYTDPATGIAHVYFSRYLNMDVTDMLKSDEVPVYIDRMDEENGYVDIDAVLPEIRIHR